MDPLDGCRTLECVHDISIGNPADGKGAGPQSSQAVSDSSKQYHQVLLLEAERLADLPGRIAYLAEMVRGPASGGLDDLSVSLERALTGRPVRAAIVAASAEQAAERLAKLTALIDSGVDSALDVAGGIFVGTVSADPAIGFLFPGQGSGRGEIDGGLLARRFETVRRLYESIVLPAGAEPTATSSAQPRIVASSVAGLRALSVLGIDASAAVGHSLGELTALHWAGAMSESTLLELACTRGRIMTDACEGDGAMAGIAAGADKVAPLLTGEPVVIAGYNGPVQTVIAGPADAVARVRKAAAEAGFKVSRIPVSDAFHSPAMAPAAGALRAYLKGLRFQPVERRVMSSVTGDILPPDADLCELLVRQLCEPVWFSQALERMAAESSLLIEVGPGRVLSGLAARICPDVPVVPLVTDGGTLSGLFTAAAAAYVLGAPVRSDRLVGRPEADDHVRVWPPVVTNHGAQEDAI